MSEAENFIIVNNELQKYVGSDVNVVIPDGVTVIAQEAFMETNIESVIIPDTVTRIGSRAFYRCDNLVKVDMPNSVNYIGTEAFMYCVNLKHVNVPKNLTCIEDSVFLGCRALDIEIPEGIVKIGARAFESTDITNVTLPKTLISVGMYAFAYCNIESVIVLGNPTFERLVFKKCKNLKEFLVPEENQTYKSIKGDLYTKDGKILVLIANTRDVLKIPYGVEIIKGWACAYSSVEEIEFPETVHLIEEFAFNTCCNLKKLSIPGNIKTIKNGAFHCDGGIATCLTELEIGEGVEVIEKDAIKGNFTSVVLPSSIKFIANFAIVSFAKEVFCVDITRIDNNANIDETAFANANRGFFTSLYSRSDLHYKDLGKSIVYSDVDECGYVVEYFPLFMLTNKTHRKLAIFAFVESIKKGSWTQKYRKEENELYIAEHYKEWLSEAVENPFLMEYFVDKKLLTKDEAFEISKSNIEKEEVRQLLLDYIKIKGYKVYKTCNKDFTVSKDITAIGCCAFYLNNKIKEIIIPETVVSIGAYAFGGADKLNRVVLNGDLKYIGDDAFVGCKKIKEFEFLGTIQQWNGVYKGKCWYLNTPAKKVVCFDGEVDL